VYFFLDDEFNRQYQSDLQFGNLFTAFSVLAIFIACLGLFALVFSSTILRMKEIGIRKVLGATIGNLMILLTREFLRPVLMAIFLAVPFIILGGQIWLNNYAFRIRLGFDIFLIPALILIVTSLLTISYRTYIAASTNPVKSLKTD
jgi:putative ABC transport system permease protein